VKLPTDLSGQELVKVLLRVGFAVNRQRGSHSSLGAGTRTAVSSCRITNDSTPELCGRFYMKQG